MRLSTRSPVFLILLVSAGCSGSDGGAGQIVAAAPTSWYEVSYSSLFDADAAANYAKSTEFQAVNADCSYYGCAAGGRVGAAKQSNPYLLTGLHYAHTAGLTGKGKMVAIVDSGFRLDHVEFAGKPVRTFGTLPTLNHGTHVAGLVAAQRDGSGMMGTAPDAELHLASFDQDQNSKLDIAHVTAATLDAASLGAVAQNNSWGFAVGADKVATYLTDHPGASLATALTSTLGYTSDEWTNYLDAFRTFQKSGVIVFASANDKSLINGSALASLPAFDTSLQGAWITAVNGYFEVDDNHNITDAVLLSAQCGYSAKFCLAGDGLTSASEAASATDYGIGLGSSYVAPQVSGAVALVSQAFPNLSPKEWTQRLLASADNTWFASQNVTLDGSVDFGNNITHSFSNEWGHGLLDIKAALEPIGSLSVLSGSNVATAQRTPLAQSAITPGSAYGNALSTAIDDENIAVFDALNGDFKINAGVLVADSEEGSTGRLPTARPKSDFRSFTSSFSFGGEKIPVSAAFGFAENMAYSFDAMPAGEDSSLLSFAKGVFAVEVSQVRGPFSFRALGFSTSSNESSDDEAVAGGAIRFGFETGFGSVSLGASQLSEDNAVLGMTGSEAFNIGEGGSSVAARFGYEKEMAPDVFLFGSYEFGTAQARGQSDGLVAGLSDMHFTGFSAGVKLKSVIRPTDSLTFSVTQPLRIESGVMALTLPVGRSPDGTISYVEKTIGLEPTGRQIDYTLGYSFDRGPRSRVALTSRFTSDADHTAGRTAVSVGAQYSLAF